MSTYRAKQVAAITDAVGAARQALRGCSPVDAARFAEIYVREGGVQIPGPEQDPGAAARIGERLLAILRGEHSDSAEPERVRGELCRIRRELAWLEYSQQEQVIGFRLLVDNAARDEPVLQPLLKSDNGLGVGVFAKYDIVVVPAELESHVRFEPVYEQELEW